MPTPDGLLAGESDTPAVLMEDTGPGGEFGTVTDKLPTPAAPAPGGEDLVYRTNPAGTDPGPGTVHSVEADVKPDRDTSREPLLNYHAVFDPAIIPFKRNSAKDSVRDDHALVVFDPTLVEIPIAGNRVAPGRQVFFGSVLIELDPGTPIPLPSVSAESRILTYETTPAVELRFFKDGGDNYFVDGAGHKGRVRVNFYMDAPNHWFRHVPDPSLSLSDVPAELLSPIPADLVPSTRKVARALGIRANMSYAATLQKLVYWFRDFDPGDLPETHGNDYVDLALGQKGVCRHRSYAFVITAVSLGIPARYVSNEAHVFVEVFVPRAGWTRIDLGGAAAGMHVRNTNQKTRHTVGGQDPFGFPPDFRNGYSNRAVSGSDDGPAGADEVTGMPPMAPVRSAEPGGLPTAARWPKGSLFGTPRAVPSAVGENQVETRTELDAIDARVYRGEKIAVRGRVSDIDGNAIAAGRVRINLMDLERQTIVRVLGNTETDNDGRFRHAVPMPMDIDLGAWEIVAEYIGDRDHGPSASD